MIDPLQGGPSVLPGQDAPPRELALTRPQESLYRLSNQLLSDGEPFPAVRAQSLGQADRIRLLEMIIQQEPLAEIFLHLAALLQRQYPEYGCAYLYQQSGADCAAGTVNLLEAIPDLAEEFHAALLEGALQLGDLDHHPLGAKLREATPEGVWRTCGTAVIQSSVAPAWGVVALLYQGLPGQDPLDEVLRELAHTAALILDHRHLYELLIRQANYDMLTGLPNRFLFEERLDAMISAERKRSGRIVVFWLDLDRFQEINESLGFQNGDEVLRIVAHRLSCRVSPKAVVARVGGDEFAVAVAGSADGPSPDRLVDQVLHALRQPFYLSDRELFMTASIGYTMFPDHGSDAATLQRNAGSALQHVKRAGRNHARVYVATLNLRLQERLELESQLQRVVERNELRLLYQPQVTPARELKGFEALLRWQHPKRGLLSPGEFIPMAEEIGLIVPIGCWVLREACRQMAEWRSLGLQPCRVAVNVSAIQLYWTEFVDAVRMALEEHHLVADRLELELTESSLLPSIDDAVEQMQRLRTLGVSLSIDDFGVGYSSLSYLQRLPVDSLKIDRSFITRMVDSGSSAALVQSIIVLGHNLGLSVVGEGIESAEQWDRVTEYGCDLLQGYLIGKPLTAEAARALLTTGWK